MRILKTFGYAAVLAFAASTSGQAQQPLSIGTSPAGSLNHSLGNAIGKVMGDTTGLQARVVPFGGGQKIMPAIVAKRFDLGLHSTSDIWFAYNGKEEFDGQALKDLRTVAVTFSYYLSWIVRNDSPYKTIADLKGKKVAIGYNANISQRRSVLSQMAAVGLAEKDFDGVPVPHVVRGADDFAQGKIESTSFAVGAGKISEVNAKIPGGIRYLDFPTDEASLKRMREVMPMGGVKLINPGPGLVGIVKPTHVQTEDYALVGSVHLNEESAYKIAKMFYEQQAALAKVAAAFSRYDPKELSIDRGVPFHPGAIRFYKEKGIWPADRK